MKKIIISTLLSSLVFLQLSASILENQYNSLSGHLSMSTGDVDATAFEIQTIGQFAEEGANGVALLLSFSHADITGVEGYDISGLDIENNALVYGLGYIFKGEGTHFIPYFGIIDAELGVNGYRAAEYDGHAIGIMVRRMISNNSAITFNVSNSDIDSMQVLGTSVSVSDVNPETTFGFTIETAIDENSSFNYGASFSDGITSFNFGVTLGF